MFFHTRAYQATFMLLPGPEQYIFDPINALPPPLLLHVCLSGLEAKHHAVIDSDYFLNF